MLEVKARKAGKAMGEVPYNMSVIQISKILPSVQAEAPTPGPSQMNLTVLMSAHGCKVFTEILQTSDAEKTFKDNLDDGLIVFCPGDDAFKNYLPKYKILASGYIHCRNNVANNSTFRDRSETKNIANHEIGFLSAENELASVHAFGSNEELLLVLESEGVAERDSSQRGEKVCVENSSGQQRQSCRPAARR